VRRTIAGGSVPRDRACFSVVPHQASSSRRISAAALVRWSRGCPVPAERFGDERDDDVVAQRDHFRLDRYVRQVLKRADCAAIQL
jgi:hypothetical protein